MELEQFITINTERRLKFYHTALFETIYKELNLPKRDKSKKREFFIKTLE